MEIKGVVFTPALIADMLAAIAQVNKDSIVIDIAAGEGALLAAAARKGCTNLIGIEINNELWNQAKGRLYTDCTWVSLYNHCAITTNSDFSFTPPNIALLNPPYSIEIDEYAFINKALEYLKPDGTLVCLVPLSKAVSRYRRDIEWKTKLLARHTLKAVITMPLRIFKDAQTVTCVMVFESHTPHSQPTWFGFWRNQELLKTVNEELRDKYLFHYFNNLEVPGISVIKQVDENDEWCAERWLDIPDGGQKLGELFNITNGSFLPLHRLVDGSTPYVSCSIKNNGVVGYKDIQPNFNNAITITNAGNPGYAFHQSAPFFASSGVLVLTPCGWQMSEEQALNICDRITEQRFRFSYGRQLSAARCRELVINIG